MTGRRVVVAAVTLGLVVGGGLATAAVKAPIAVKACVDSNGYLSLASKHKCAKGSKLTSISVKGAQGLRGVTGMTGATGATGASGTNGSNGVAGPPGADGLSAVYSSYAATTNVPYTEANVYLTAVTVPPGSYIVHWEAEAVNQGATDADLGCGLSTAANGTGLNFAGVSRYVALPGMHDNVFPLTASFPLRTTQNLTLQIYCSNTVPGDNATSTQKMVGALLTITATSHLYDQTGTVNYPGPA